MKALILIGHLLLMSFSAFSSNIFIPSKSKYIVPCSSLINDDKFISGYLCSPEERERTSDYDEACFLNYRGDATKELKQLTRGYVHTHPINYAEFGTFNRVKNLDDFNNNKIITATSILDQDGYDEAVINEIVLNQEEKFLNIKVLGDKTGLIWEQKFNCVKINSNQK